MSNPKTPATTQTSVMPFVQTELPEHLKNTGSVGNEEVGAEDQTIPRLNLLQKASPQCDETKPEFLAEAKAGLFHNSVTNELYTKLYVINLLYRKTVAAFKKRDLGGGFAGNHANTAAAVEALTAEGLDPKSYDLVETGNHYCLILDENGAPKQPALLSMNGSKLRVSNQWNTQILARGDNIPRYSGVWQLSSVIQSNAKGSWSNISIDYVGYASEELVNEAAKLYTALQSDEPKAEAA